MTLSPTATSSGTRLPLSSMRPEPIARTSPSWGFSLAVSGITRPEAVVCSASLDFTTMRSSRGLMETDTCDLPFGNVEDGQERMLCSEHSIRSCPSSTFPKGRSHVSVSIKPLEDRIVVKSSEAEQTTASGLVIPDTAKEKPQEGEVLAIGPGRIDDNGNRVPLDVAVGDKVIYSKYGGTEVKYDGEES